MRKTANSVFQVGSKDNLAYIHAIHIHRECVLTSSVSQSISTIKAKANAPQERNKYEICPLFEKQCTEVDSINLD